MGLSFRVLGCLLKLLAPLLLLACIVSLIYFFADNSTTGVMTTPEPLPPAPVTTMPHEVKITTTMTNQGSLVLNNPEITMDVERGVLQAKVHITVYLPTVASPFSGFIIVSGTPQLAEASKQFFLREATIENLELPELPASARTRVDKALMTGVRTFFEQNAAYTPLNQPKPQNNALSIEL